eukprot:2793915-Prymnesium_polylepis.1
MLGACALGDTNQAGLECAPRQAVCKAWASAEARRGAAVVAEAAVAAAVAAAASRRPPRACERPALTLSLIHI